MNMSTDNVIRRRKTYLVKTSHDEPISSTLQRDKPAKEINSALLFYVNLIIGLSIMMVCSYYYAVYCHTIHETHMWFSNIEEVEREISFRTEAGLYYSYYKQFLNAKTVIDGINQLVYDNYTEYPHTINVIARMNVYQEIFLAVIYRSSSYLQVTVKPIFFYICTIFGLHGVLLSALYMITWFISGSWLAGVLASAFYVINKQDTTRVASTIPLRESFSLPFLWLQLALITWYFQPRRTKLQEKFCLFGILLTTWLFALFWQFNQFVLLLQSMALFGVQVLHIVPHHKVKAVYCVQVLSLLLVSVMQFFNPMIITGPVLSFVPAALLMMYLQGERPNCDGIMTRIVKILLQILGVFIVMFSLNKVIKMCITVDSDEHIYKFVRHKFGLEEYREMDVWMYLCIGSFKYLDMKTYYRLTEKFVLPLYVLFQVGGLIAIFLTLLKVWRQKRHLMKDNNGPSHDTNLRTDWLNTRPELAYHLIQTVFFGVMAITTLRMKFLWTPYMCILGSSLITDRYLYSWILNKGNKYNAVLMECLRHLMCAVVIYAVYYTCIGGVKEELNNLREFHDPDTVQLMDWINNNTEADAAFSGSMQLLAGVRLCTGRPITNHPHYEDKTLRHTTKQIYQIYGRKPVDEVYAILRQYNTSYIIIEDSICMQPIKNECATPNLVDMHNGVTTLTHKIQDGVVLTTAKKFCEEIRHMKPLFDRYFKAVFRNRTFRIYQVLDVGQNAMN